MQSPKYCNRKCLLYEFNRTCCPVDLFHNQNLRQGQSGASTETSRLRETTGDVGRCVERRRRIRGQILARQGSRRGRG